MIYKRLFSHFISDNIGAANVQTQAQLNMADSSMQSSESYKYILLLWLKLKSFRFVLATTSNDIDDNVSDSNTITTAQGNTTTLSTQSSNEHRNRIIRLQKHTYFFLFQHNQPPLLLQINHKHNRARLPIHQILVSSINTFEFCDVNNFFCSSKW